MRASTGNDSNGGAFVAGAAGTDRSQQAGPQVSIDNATISATSSASTITFTAGYTATSADVGNVYQDSGTAGSTAGFYQITGFTSTTWTLDRAIGTSTGLIGRMGGALASITKLSPVQATSQKAWATGSFTQTAGATFTAVGGNPGPATPPTTLIGYGSVRGDTGRATITLSTNSGLTALTFSNGGWMVKNLIVDCANLATSVPINTSGSQVRIENCKFLNFTQRGSLLTSETFLLNCEWTAGTSAASAAIHVASSGVVAIGCSVHDCACPAVYMGSGLGVLLDCVFANLTGASTDGVTNLFRSLILHNCTFYNIGRHGINPLGSGWPGSIRNNLFSTIGGYCIQLSNAAGLPADYAFDGNAFHSYTSGKLNNYGDTSVNAVNGVAPYTNSLDVDLGAGASPFVNAAGGDLRLNSTAGAGALLRGTGVPGAWPGFSFAAYPDFGAVQHQDSGGGSTYVFQVEG